MNNTLELPVSVDPGIGKRTRVQADGRYIALFNVDGRIYAIDDSCPHNGASLLFGHVDGCWVQCPAHGLRFDLVTGCMRGGGLNVRTYPVEVAKDCIRITLPLQSPATNNFNSRLIMTQSFTTARHWQQSYDARVPADINPDTWPSVVAMAEDAMQRHASHTAFHCFDRSLSYADVDAQSGAFAAYLQHLGVQRGDRIAVMLPNIPAFPVAMFGVLRAGAAQVNVNPTYTPQELLHQLNDAGVQIIVIIASALPALEAILVSTTIKKVIVVQPRDTLDGHVGTGDFDIPSPSAFPMTRFTDALHEGGMLQLTPVELTGDDLLFLQYTGGTTGPSKGAALSHRNLIANIMQARAFLPDMFDPDGDNVVVTALPLFHVFALTINLLIGFSAGAENWLVPDARNSDDLVGTLIKARPTLLTGVNTLYGALVRHPRIGEVDFSRLRLAIGGGAAVLPATSTLWKNITGQEILEGYGLSETSAILCLNVMGRSQFSAAVGLPLPSTDIVLLKDDDQPAAPGEAGEIAPRGRRSCPVTGKSPRPMPTRSPPRVTSAPATSASFPPMACSRSSIAKRI